MTPSALRLTPSPPEQPPSICEQTRQWIKSVINLTRESIEKLNKAKITDLITGTFPEPVSTEILQLTCDWTTIFFCLDDFLETLTSTAEVKTCLEELISIYKEGCTSSNNPFASGMASIGERLRKLAPHLAPEFSARLQALFNAFVIEANYRTTKTCPKINKYLDNRRFTIGVQTGFILGLGIQNIDLPLELLNHPIIKDIEEQACLIIGLENDLGTAQRELEKYEVNNGVIILMNQGATFDKAVNRINQNIRSIDEKLQVAEAFLSNLGFSSEVKIKVAAYINIIKAYIAAHRTWAVNTGRYNVNSVVMKNG